MRVWWVLGRGAEEDSQQATGEVEERDSRRAKGMPVEGCSVALLEGGGSTKDGVSAGGP